MSHVAHVDLHVKDLACLEMACKRLGLTIEKGSYYRWYGRWMNDYHAQEAAASQGFDPKQFGKNAQYVIKGEGCEYDVGVVPRIDGKPGFSLLYDNYQRGRGLEAIIGKGACTLKQSYAVEVSKRQMIIQGFQVSERKNANGTISIHAVK